MNCPNCNVSNEPGSLFCISCGHSLAGVPATGGGSHSHASAEESARQLLGIHTLRLVFGLLVLFVFYRVLINLSFVETMRIPDFPFTVTEIIRALVYLVMLVLLVGYASSLRTLWPRAYPKWSAFTSILVALVYIAVIAAAYTAVARPLLVLTEEPDAVLVLQVVLLVLAVLILGAAWMSFYTDMPSWLRNLRLNVPVHTTHEVACLNCGYLNPDTNQYCGNCGNEMKPNSEPVAEA